MQYLVAGNTGAHSPASGFFGDNGPSTGATIADWRGQWGRLANTEVAVSVDADRARQMFFDAMLRLADGPEK